MFIHDEPNWEAVDLEATRACLLCADDGKGTATEAEPEDSLTRGHPVPDDTEVLLTLLMHNSYPAITMATGQDEYLELCHTVNAAKFAYQKNGGSRLAEPLLPREGEHLCVPIYAATGITKAVVQT